MRVVSTTKKQTLPDRQRQSWPARHRAATRFIVGVVLGTIVGFAIPSPLSLADRVLAAWDVGALTVCLLTWIVIVGSNAEHVNRRAAEEDSGRTFVHIITLLSCAAGLFAAAIVFAAGRSASTGSAIFNAAMCVATVAISWTLTHTLFALRYAHLYYRDDGARAEPRRLSFPGTEPPDDMDFAYFSFVIGMTFQVSDVEIVDRSIRRAVLGHSVLSFVYNTAILAVALNLVSSTLQR